MFRITRVLAIVSLFVVLAACAAGSSFKPTTVEGANCKAQCARDMAACRASSYTCDRAASTCMTACEELDTVAGKKQK